MVQKTLLVDMDGTLARFHDEVNYLERMFEKGFFDNLRPFKNVVEGIRAFIAQHPDVSVFACSAAVQSPYCITEKDAWLDKYLPEIPKDKRLYTEMGRSKAEYLPDGATKDVFLLDDYNRGLYKFLYDGGSAIKCHNNINQQGRGAHGGERGFLWEGPMIHAENPPSLIAAELAELMGLEHSIEHTAEDLQVQYIGADDTAQDNEHAHLKELSISGDPNWGTCYMASPAHATQKGSKAFLNPYNALRYLCGDALAVEYGLRASNGRELVASGYQLQAICLNSFGHTDFQKVDRTQLADAVLSATGHRSDAVVGIVWGIGEDGQEYGAHVFYDHKSMEHFINDYEYEGQAYRAERFIEPPASARAETISDIEIEPDWVASPPPEYTEGHNVSVSIQLSKRDKERIQELTTKPWSETCSAYGLYSFDDEFPLYYDSMADDDCSIRLEFAVVSPDKPLKLALSLVNPADIRVDFSYIDGADRLWCEKKFKYLGNTYAVTVEPKIPQQFFQFPSEKNEYDFVHGYTPAWHHRIVEEAADAFARLGAPWKWNSADALAWALENTSTGPHDLPFDLYDKPLQDVDERCKEIEGTLDFRLARIKSETTSKLATGKENAPGR